MKPEFTVVIPVLNEEESLQELLARIDDAFKKLSRKYEVLFIDDGSTDGSLELIKKYSRDHENIRVISFRRNMGKSIALTLGFRKAKGDFVITMDADLQDDPANIERLISKQEERDYDVVSGWRKDRKDSTLKIINSKLFNSIIIPLLFNVKFHDMNSGLKLYKKDSAKEIKIYGGMHRFIPVIASKFGFKVTETPITHHPRKYGYSKFKSTKILTDIPDLMTMFFLIRYTNRPLHFFSKLGGTLFLIGSAILFYLVMLKLLFGEAIGGRPILIFGVLFVITGLQIIFTGLLADLFVNLQRDDSDGQLPIRYES